MRRRNFLSSAAAAAVLGRNAMAEPTSTAQSTASGSSQTSGAANIPRVTSAGTLRGEMLYRELGSTGEQVSLIGMGGAHLGLPEVEEGTAIRLIHVQKLAPQLPHKTSGPKIGKCWRIHPHPFRTIETKHRIAARHLFTSNPEDLT